jgi:hypothetical protein
MAKRTTISIPDVLYEKMEKWSNSINFSKEFRDHISSVIKNKEELQKKVKGGKEMVEIIERLRREKMENIIDYQQEGYAFGVAWAKEAHYLELRSVVDWESTDLNDLPYDENIEDLKSDLREYFSNYIQEDDFLDYDDWHHGHHNEHIEKFIEGWKEGVEAFWKEVKHKL